MHVARQTTVEIAAQFSATVTFENIWQ